MAEIHVSAERQIDAPPERVYQCIADYHQHRTFLPSAFSDLKIEEGGVGTGTVVSFTVDREGAGSRVRIDTRWQGATGLGGFMERTFAPRVLKKLYTEELEMLDRYAREQAGRGV